MGFGDKMLEAAPHAMRTILFSCLGCAAGDALYRWWRHGSVDWIGVGEIVLGWWAAMSGFALLAKLKEIRELRRGREGNA